MEGPGYKSVPLGDDPFSNALRERIKGLPHYRTVLQWKEDIDVPLEKTDYYRWLKDTVESEGSVWGYIKTEEDMIRCCKNFRDLYRIAPDWTSESPNQEPVFQIVLPDGTSHYLGEYPTRIEDNGSLSLLDGWHRMAILVALGLPIEITICERTPGWQNLVKRLGEIYPDKLYQPIPHPEFSAWPAHRDDTKEKIVKQFIVALNYKSVLDLGCSHGFTLYSLRDVIDFGEAVEIEQTRFEISEIILNAINIRCHKQDAIEFLATSKKNYDVILALAVLHNIAKAHSKEEFTSFLKTIRTRCRAFIYELPDPCEESYQMIWPEMRETIHQHIEQIVNFGSKTTISYRFINRNRNIVILEK